MRGLRSKKRRLERILRLNPTKILTNPLKLPILVGAKAQNKTTGEEPVVR